MVGRFTCAAMALRYSAGDALVVNHERRQVNAQVPGFEQGEGSQEDVSLATQAVGCPGVHLRVEVQTQVGGFCHPDLLSLEGNPAGLGVGEGSGKLCGSLVWSESRDIHACHGDAGIYLAGLGDAEGGEGCQQEKDKQNNATAQRQHCFEHRTGGGDRHGLSGSYTGSHRVTGKFSCKLCNVLFYQIPISVQSDTVGKDTGN